MLLVEDMFDLSSKLFRPFQINTIAHKRLITQEPQKKSIHHVRTQNSEFR
jgi:hypothetical protein